MRGDLHQQVCGAHTPANVIYNGKKEYANATKNMVAALKKAQAHRRGTLAELEATAETTGSGAPPMDLGTSHTVGISPTLG